MVYLINWFHGTQFMSEASYWGIPKLYSIIPTESSHKYQRISSMILIKQDISCIHCSWSNLVVAAAIVLGNTDKTLPVRNYWNTVS